jgi:hypothetical protein
VIAGGTVIEIEDLVVRDSIKTAQNGQAQGSKSDQKRNKVYFVVMVESVDNLSCYQFHASDEIFTYYWVLDSISFGKLQSIDAYKLHAAEE